jgi:hypothetical protein
MALRGIEPGSCTVWLPHRSFDLISECAKNVLRKDHKINDRFYLSQVINEIILGQKPVGLFEIPNSKYHPLKNEMQLAQYLAEYRALKESK